MGSVSQIPNGAAGRFLMGTICKQSEGRTAAAVEYFSQALTMDPFLWSAYEEICQLGAEKEAQALLQNPDLESLYPGAVRFCRLPALRFSVSYHRQGTPSPRVAA
eukprot:9476954-Pyramimonas_sp.AAC.2